MTACAISRKRLLRSNVSMALYVRSNFLRATQYCDEIWIIRGALKKEAISNQPSARNRGYITSNKPA